MSTLEQLKKRLEYYTDQIWDDDEVVTLFNDCQDDIHEVAGYAVTKTTTLEEGIISVDLPSDLVSLAEIKMLRSSDNLAKRLLPLHLIQQGDARGYNDIPISDAYGYEHFGQSITIVPDPKDSITLDMRYFSTLPEIPTGDMEYVPQLRTKFHGIYPLYAAMRFFQGYQDRLAEKRDYQAEYLAKRTELKADTEKIKGRARPRKVIQYRSWT